MKRNFRFLLLTFSSLIMLFTGTNVYAHEMYWTKSGSNLTTIPLRWINKNTNTGRLKVTINNASLTGEWVKYFEDARGAWHYSALPVEFVTTTGAPNTYIATTSKEFWAEKFPLDSEFSENVGYTDLYDSNSSVINSYVTASNSTKKIKGANIYLKPNPISPSTFMYQSIMSHEFGHVLCLGHSHEANYNPANVTTDPSIMSYTYRSLGKSYLPQNHELNDVKFMYGY